MNQRQGASEERAGGARGDDGDIHVYRSHEGPGWARLCVVPDQISHRADAVLSPSQAAGFADDIDRLLRRAPAGAATPWWGERCGGGPLGSGRARVAYLSSSQNHHRRVLEVEAKSGTVLVLASDEALSEVAAVLRDASGQGWRPASGMDGARRRTDDNLRGVFG